jgi:Mrp family chromosome partitioning ATPase/capsular polysaccharide biosynthesis protein
MEQNNQAQVVLGFLRRNWWLVLLAVVTVGTVTYVLVRDQPVKPAQATATFILRPDSEDLTSYGTARVFLTAQQRVIRGAALAAEVAPQVGLDPATVRRSISVSADTDASVVSITATSTDSQIPVKLANAYVETYVTKRADQKKVALQQRADELSAQVAKLEEQLAKVDADLASARRDDRDSTSLTLSKEALVRQYAAVVTAQQDVLTKISQRPVVAEVLDPAEFSTRPQPPSWRSRVAIGILAGLLLGIGLGVLRELLADRLRDRKDAERITELPVIGEIGLAVRPISGLPAYDKQFSSVAESFRGIRTNLRFLAMGDELRIVGVTSAEPKDGKSTVAANLAASFALAGLSTIVVSGDLRRQRLDDLFEVRGRPGLSDLLASRASGLPLRANADGWPAGSHTDELTTLLIPTKVPNLLILPAGTAMPNPAELLSTPQAREVFRELAELADIVIVDSAPLLVADGLLIGRLVDGVVVVASVQHTRRERLNRATNALRSSGANVVGLVVNRVRSPLGGYGRYYRYYEPQKATKESGRQRRERNDAPIEVSVRQ